MPAEIQGYLDTLDGMRRSIRQALEGVDTQGLNWNPLPGDANSLYAIVSHVCTSEINTIHGRIAGGPLVPDAHAAFAAQGEDANELLSRLDGIGVTTRTVLEGIDAEGLDREIDPGGGRPPRSVRGWISMHVRHTALHLGHIEITKQFYEPGIVGGR